jgi:hypothetical protein
MGTNVKNVNVVDFDVNVDVVDAQCWPLTFLFFSLFLIQAMLVTLLMPPVVKTVFLPLRNFKLFCLVNSVL